MNIKAYAERDSTRKSQMVSIGAYDFYFSYDQIVGVYIPGRGLVCCENIWSNTTGRHLNAIQPDKSKRVSYEEFMGIINEVEGLFKG